MYGDGVGYTIGETTLVSSFEWNMLIAITVDVGSKTLLQQDYAGLNWAASKHTLTCILTIKWSCMSSSE